MPITDKKPTLKDFAMSEHSDWYAFPPTWTRHEVAAHLVHDLMDWWLGEHEAVWIDDNDVTHGWVTAYRDLLSKINQGYVRLAGPDDDFDTYYDEWWFECERDHPDAEPAWIVKL